MPRYQYAGNPSTPPALTGATISGNLTAGTAGTYSFWLQTQNRAGFSLVSPRTEVTATAGQGIRLTIPASALPSPSGGVDIRAYSILCSATTDSFDAVIVAANPGYDTDDTSVLSPPFTVDLAEDAHLNLGNLSVAASANLPSGGDRLNGMRRSISDLSGAIYEWNAAAAAWLLAIPQSFTGYTTNLESGLGANRSLGALDNLSEIIYPSYDLTGFSTPVKYWLANNESTAIAQGKRVALTISADIEGVDTDLTNLAGVIGALELTFLGFANTTTGALDTTGSGGIGSMAGVGEAITYTGDGDTTLILQKDLPVGSAYVLQVRANLDVATLSEIVPDGTVIKLTPSFFDEAATPNDAAAISGSVILGEYDRRRLVPTAGINAIALNGSGVQKLPLSKGFSFSNVGQQTVVGLEANAADQLVSINVSGDCIVVDTVPDYAALRAIVGTVNGQGKATAWSAAVALSNALYVQVAVTYSTAIRLDYDDVIAGSSLGTFNADIVRIYVRPTGGGNAIYWDFPVTPGNATDTFTVGATAGTDSGDTEPPARPSERFGLYEPSDNSFTPTATAGSSVFTSQNYEVAIAFRFDTTITSIDHRPSSGCITEVDGTLADLFQLLNYLGTPVDTVWDLRRVGESDRATNKEVFCAAQGNPYRWQAGETSTQDADLSFSATTSPGPASGQVRLNSATLAAVTSIYVSETDANSTAIAALLEAIAENQTLRIQSVGTETTYAEYVVSAAADSGNYRTLTVTHGGSNGTFSDTDEIVVSWGAEFVRPFDINYPSAGRWVKDDSDQILVLDADPTGEIGETGDLAVIRNDGIATYGDVLKKTSTDTWTTLFNFLPYSLTTASFTQPAVDANVTASVRNSRLFPSDSFVQVEGGGIYQVVSRPTSSSLQLRNTGNTINAAVSATVASGGRIYNSGSQGAPGSSAIALSTANFTQPAEDATVSVTVDSTQGFVAGQYLYTDAATGNNYQIVTIDSATQLTLRNLQGQDNAAAGTVISSGSKFVPTGRGGGDANSSTPVAQTIASRTLTTGDIGKTIVVDSIDERAIEIPTNASAAIAVGSLVRVFREGTGQAVIRPADGVTVNGLARDAAQQIQSTKQYGMIELWQQAANTWFASRDWESAATTLVGLLENGLLAWWSFEDNLNDSGPNGITLSLIGQPIIYSTSPVGRDFFFQGRDTVLLANNAALDSLHTTGFYVACVFNPQFTSTSNDWQNLIGQHDVTTARKWRIRIENVGADTARIEASNAAAADIGSAQFPMSWNNTDVYFIEAYFDPSVGDHGRLGIAVDNAVFVTADLTEPMQTTPTSLVPISIGGDSVNAGGGTWNTNAFAEGRLDFVAIWSGVFSDLSPTGPERSALWNSGNFVNLPSDA